MNRRQKNLVLRLTMVIIVTATAVVAMTNLKDWVNRSEAMRATRQLGRHLVQYRKEHGFVPSESFVDRIRDDLEGGIRLGKMDYRALWINMDSGDDEILAYSARNYPGSFLDDGFIVLRLDGRVDWMGKKEFEELLAKQQSRAEIEMLRIQR